MANGRILSRADVGRMSVPAMMSRKQRIEIAMKFCLRAAQARSKEKRLPFDITMDWLLEQVERQNFCCQLTGIEFYAKPPSHGKVRPYAPSLDRIKTSGGYTKDNVRVVIRAINTMFLDWGHEVFEQVVVSYLRHQKNPRKVA